MFHAGFPVAGATIVFLAGGSYDSATGQLRPLPAKKKPAEDPPASFRPGRLSNLDGRSQTFGAQHLRLFLLSLPNGHFLQVGLERSPRGSLGKRTIVSEGQSFTALFALCHCQIPSWSFSSDADSGASYHRM
jgi:hypothetical protein